MDLLLKHKWVKINSNRISTNSIHSTVKSLCKVNMTIALKIVQILNKTHNNLITDK